MQSASMELSGSTQSRTATSQAELDKYLAILSENATRLPSSRRVKKRRFAGLCATASVGGKDWVAAACQAKGLRVDSPAAGEEWLGGPYVTMRCLRKLIVALEDIARVGKPQLPSGAIQLARDGRTEVLVMPGKPTITRFRRVLPVGCGCWPATTIDEFAKNRRSSTAKRSARRRVADSWRWQCGLDSTDGRALQDVPRGQALHRQAQPGERIPGAVLRKAFQPLVERGYLRFVYGGAEVGSYLSYHPQIVDMHITGSDRTHDLIVWVRRATSACAGKPQMIRC